MGRHNHTIERSKYILRHTDQIIAFSVINTDAYRFLYAAHKKVDCCQLKFIFKFAAKQTRAVIVEMMINSPAARVL